MARKHGVTLLCFPPHTSHKMQPQDVAFMRPLSMEYTDAVMTFQRRGKFVTLKDVFHLFGEAFKKAAKVETAINAFRCTGIYPLNDKIFDKYFENETVSNGHSSDTSPEFRRSREILQRLTNRPTKNNNPPQPAQSVQASQPSQSIPLH